MTKIYVFLKLVYRFCFITFPSFYYSVLSNLSYNPTHIIRGKCHIIKMNFLLRIFLKKENGRIEIGNYFTCNNKMLSNSLGLIQPCIFNITTPGSLIKIGNNVGISGTSINACSTITIGNNVLIGSGCVISDTDSHSLNWTDRINGDNKIKVSPIKIEDNVFIGARCIILKGVTIGYGSVIGAGSVVSKSIPPNCIACGNPAEVKRKLK